MARNEGLIFGSEGVKVALAHCLVWCTIGPFTVVNISRLSLGWAWDAAFTPDHPEMNVNHAWLWPRVGMNMAHIWLYVIGCLKCIAVVCKCSRQMTQLRRWWYQSSDSRVVQIADRLTAAYPEPSQAWAWPGLQCKWIWNTQEIRRTLFN